MSIPSARLIRVLHRLIDCCELPDAIRLYHGPEMVSDAFTECAAANFNPLSNRANPTRMPSSGGSIALIAPKCSMHTCSPTSSRFKHLPIDGWSMAPNTAHTAPINPLTVGRQQMEAPDFGYGQRRVTSEWEKPHLQASNSSL